MRAVPDLVAGALRRTVEVAGNRDLPASSGWPSRSPSRSRRPARPCRGSGPTRPGSPGGAGTTGRAGRPRRGRAGTSPGRSARSVAACRYSRSTATTRGSRSSRAASSASVSPAAGRTVSTPTSGTIGPARAGRGGRSPPWPRPRRGRPPPGRAARAAPAHGPSSLLGAGQNREGHQRRARHQDRSFIYLRVGTRLEVSIGSEPCPLNCGSPRAGPHHGSIAHAPRAAPDVDGTTQTSLTPILAFLRP